jgi:hypothetical protein
MGNASRLFRRLGLLTLPALLVAFALEACVDKEELTTTTDPARVMGPDCASCHSYPPPDTNHAYHLFDGLNLKAVNGAVTCIDCHFTAVKSRTVAVLDSIFLDSLGNEWSSLDFPNDADIRAFALGRVDTVVQDHAVEAPLRPGGKPLFQEYITSLAHMNGKVDVAFHPRVTDTSKFPGLPAVYLPEKETCSAMSCHPGVETPYWRFADSAKGLRELKGNTGDFP